MTHTVKRRWGHREQIVTRRFMMPTRGRPLPVPREQTIFPLPPAAGPGGWSAVRDSLTTDAVAARTLAHNQGIVFGHELMKTVTKNGHLPAPADEGEAYLQYIFLLAVAQVVANRGRDLAGIGRSKR